MALSLMIATMALGKSLADSRRSHIWFMSSGATALLYASLSRNKAHIVAM